jgi:hypothetical protein
MLKRLRKQSRVERLEAENQELRERLLALEARALPIPGIAGAGEDALVTVGGREVKLRPLPPQEWAAALGKLPGFLLAYAIAQQKRESMRAEDLEELVTEVRGWVKATCTTEVDVQDMSVPEVMHAAVVIARKNGLDESLSQFFRERLTGPVGGPGGQKVRDPAARPPQARTN